MACRCWIRNAAVAAIHIHSRRAVHHPLAPLVRLQSHYSFLENHNVSWKIYYNDDPWMAPAFADLRTPAHLALIQEMPAFFTDITAGTLPQFSFIQPRMATSSTGPSNWQHPDNSVEAGEQLMSDVYTSLRNSSYWNETLLIITYDEHGG